MIPLTCECRAHLGKDGGSPSSVVRLQAAHKQAAAEDGASDRRLGVTHQALVRRQRLRVDAVVKMDARDVSGGISLEDPEPHLRIDVSPKGLVERPYLVDDVPRHHHRRAVDGIRPEDRHKQIRMSPGKIAAVGLETAVRVDGVEAHEREAKRRFGEEGGDLERDLVGHEGVVRTQPTDERPAARRDAAVKGVRRTLVALTLLVDPIAVAGEDIRRRVGRAVVTDDDLDGGIRLRKDTLDAVAQVPCLVVRRDDDRDERCIRGMHGPHDKQGGPRPSQTPGSLRSRPS